MSADQVNNPLDPKAKIAQRLKNAREGLGLTQVALAKQAGIGRSTIIHYETGKVLPGGMELIKLAKALNVTPNYVLSGTERFFESEEPEHALASDDFAVTASRAVLCLKALDQEIRESFSAMLMSVLKQQLGAVRYEEFVKVLDAVEPYMRKMANGMNSEFESIIDRLVDEDIPGNLPDKPEE